MLYYTAVNWWFSAFRVDGTRQLSVQRRSYNVIYGSGVNYGNTDLLFTSHQTDNWPVSCCYDGRRGPEDCHACLHALTQADGKQEQIPIGQCSESQMNFAVVGTGQQIGPDKTPLKVGSHIFPSPTQCQDNLIFFFSFLENKTFIPPPLFALSICISKKSHRDLLCIFTSD